MDYEEKWGYLKDDINNLKDILEFVDSKGFNGTSDTVNGQLTTISTILKMMDKIEKID